VGNSCVSGVYAFWCQAEGRCYVGGSVNIEWRKRRHLYRLRSGKHSNKPFQAAFDIHGESSLEFVILDLCTPESVAALESHWVRELEGALFNPPAAALTSGTPGIPHSAETKVKISSSLTGREKSLEHRQNLWNNRQGWKHSEESKAKISEGLLNAAKNGNRSGPPDGWKHSEQSRSKMSEQRRGVPKSPEHRAKIAAAVRAARRRK